MSTRQLSLRLFVLICVATLGPAGHASAATYTWYAQGNDNWFSSGLTLSTIAFDVPAGTTLTPADSLEIRFAEGEGQFANQNGNASITNLLLGNVDLTSSSTSTLTVSGSIIFFASTKSVTIANPVQFVTGSAVVSVGSTLGGTLSIIQGSGNFTKAGSSTLNLPSASAYTGTMTLSSGTVTNAGGLFAGSVVNNGGTFIGGTVSGAYAQTAGSGTVNVLSSLSSLSGGTLRVNQTVSQNFTQNGGLLTGTGGPNSNALSLDQEYVLNSGTGNIRGANSISQSGGEIVFSSGTVTAASTLGGVNSITGTVGSTMTFNGPLVLGAGNSTTLDVAGPGVADKYVVTGLLTYGGTLNVNFTTSGTQANGTTWSLFDPLGGVSGSFAAINGIGQTPYAGLAWGLAATSSNYYDQKYGDGIWLSSWTGSGTSAQRLIFNQATGDITVVPEPSTFVMAGAGIAGWGLLRYRRRRSRAAAAAASEPAESSSAPVA